MHALLLQLDVKRLAETLYEGLAAGIISHERNSMRCPHRPAENEPAASSQRKSGAEMIGDIEMRKRVEAKPLHKFVAIFVEKAARIARAGVRNHKAYVEISDRRGEARDSVQLGEIRSNTPRFDTKLVLKLQSQLREQGLAARREHNVQSGRRQLSRELGADA